MFCFSLLVNSTNLELIIGYLKSFYIIFGSEFADKMVNKNYSMVKESFKCIGEESFISEELCEGDIGNNDEKELTSLVSEEDAIVASNRKPFLPYINGRLKNCTTICSDSSNPKNPFYQPEFRNVLEQKWIGLIPFWTSIMRGTKH